MNKSSGGVDENDNNNNNDDDDDDETSKIFIASTTQTKISLTDFLNDINKTNLKLNIDEANNDLSSKNCNNLNIVNTYDDCTQEILNISSSEDDDENDNDKRNEKLYEKELNFNELDQIRSFTSIEDNSNNLALVQEARVWSELEAHENQFPQKEASSCGAIAILNVLKALKYEFDFDTVISQVKFNKRDEHAPIAQYLFSRSVAGMNAQELIENISRVSQERITGRFFSFYPARDIDLLTWLKHWISKGAIPVALLNLQKTPIWGFIPDAWHHQMIYACDDSLVFLTNPLETKTPEALMKELTSDSVLLVRNYDILKRFNEDNSDLSRLINECDARWLHMNVLGQVINVLRSQTMSLFTDSTIQRANYLTSHIEIPASYQSGITLFVYRDSNLCKELMDAHELPFNLNK